MQLVLFYLALFVGRLRAMPAVVEVRDTPQRFQLQCTAAVTRFSFVWRSAEGLRHSCSISGFAACHALFALNVKCEEVDLSVGNTQRRKALAC